ncbi:Uncharacterised protein [Mycobacteroides abscessus subsp. abscessus]|nr:Uncharacterised protein [Mycobacteroides abscessus subsp. abscessus]
MKTLDLRKVVLFALKATSGILVKAHQVQIRKFSMIVEKILDKMILQKKCIQGEKMNVSLKYGI